MADCRRFQRVAVLGGGSYGTALAHLAARQGQRVFLWMRDSGAADALNLEGRNPNYLSEWALHERVRATADVEEALEDADWVVIAVPTSALRLVLSGIVEQLRSKPLVLGVKGIEQDTLMTPREIVLELGGGENWDPEVLLLSGPSFAHEIMENQPTAVVLACQDESLAAQIADVHFCDTFRAYTSPDVIGVEMGGALKNVIAIAAGIVRGMGFGHNSTASLVTRGLAEMTRMAVAKGGNPLTLAGLSGLGDLMLTCTGSLSRNLRAGLAIGAGESLEEALSRAGGVVEGLGTARSAYQLARRLDVETPIMDGVYRILHEGLPLQDGLKSLVRRHPGRELEY